MTAPRRTAHFDAMTGASGDMILGALVDAGASIDEIRRALATLDVPGFHLEAREDSVHGFRALRLVVEVPDEKRDRHLPEIESILDGGGLSPRVVADAKRVFARLAEAEARSHGMPVEKVHFHEVGALDAILDIAGAAVALELLGVDRVTFSPLRLGTGEVQSAHGRIPVPVPAVLELTRNVPTVRTDIEAELLTPTGAAILTTLGRPNDGSPLVVESVGVARGTRDLPDRPNVLRVSVGVSAVAVSKVATAPGWELDEVVVLETNLDDMTAEMIPSVVEHALASGARDAFVTPVLMKKGRPGHLLTVLVAPEDAEKLAGLLFCETSTFGVRWSHCFRWKLPRESREVKSRWGPVLVKVGDLGGGDLRVTPEYESCRALADRTGVPLQQIYREVEELIRSSEWVSSGREEP